MIQPNKPYPHLELGKMILYTNRTPYEAFNYELWRLFENLIDGANATYEDAVPFGITLQMNDIFCSLIISPEALGTLFAAYQLVSDEGLDQQQIDTFVASLLPSDMLQLNQETEQAVSHDNPDEVVTEQTHNPEPPTPLDGDTREVSLYIDTEIVDSSNPDAEANPNPSTKVSRKRKD